MDQTYPANQNVSDRRFSLFFPLLLLFSGELISQPSVIRFDNYSTKDGLPDNIALDVIRDNKGFVWIYTNSGITRFDGLNFRTYPLPVETIYTDNLLEEDKAGNLWATNGFVLYRFDRIKDNFEPCEPADSEKIHIIFIRNDFKDGLLWFKKGTGLYCSNPFSQSINLAKNNLPAKSIRCYRDEKGQFWFEGNGEMHVYELERDSSFKVSFTDFANHYINENTGLGLLEYFYDVLYYATSGKTKKSGGASNFPDLKTFRSDRHTECPALAGDSLLFTWNKEYEGIRILSKSRNDYTRHFRHSKLNSQSISDDWVRAMYADAGGILWMGTSKGLSMANPLRQHIVRYDMPAGNDKAESVFISNASGFDFEDCILYFDGKQVAFRFEGQLKTIDISRFLRDNAYLGELLVAACFDLHGNIWITSNAGIHRINRRKGLIDFSYLLDRTCNSTISNIECDKSNKLSFIWNGKVVFWHIESPHKHTVLDLNPSKSNNFNAKQVEIITVKQMGCDGNLWLSGKSGSFIFRADHRNEKVSRRYNLSQLNKLKFIAKGDILDMDLDRTGRLWITLPYGLAQMDTLSGKCDLKALESTYKPYHTSGAFTNSSIDSSGNIWSSSRLGIYCYDPARDRFFSFTEKEGASGDYSTSVFSLRNYIFTRYPDNTFDRIDPYLALKPLPVPNVYLDGFKIADDEQFFDRDSAALYPFRLSYRDNIITFKYTAVDFTAPEKITFQYRLDGFDDVWHDAGTRREVTYTNLGSGHYTFRVRAINGDGAVSPGDAVMKIYVQPPYWATWWFRTFLALAFLALIYAISRYREIQRLQHEKLRLRIARDLHDEMGSTLSSISILSEAALRNLQADIDRARFGVIGERARQVMEAMSDIVWSVNPRNDNMANVLQRMKEFAVEILEPQGIALHFEADEAVGALNLPMEQRKDFYLLFKEAVNNAAKYSGATDVWVTVQSENGSLHLEVRDNGRGFDVEQVKRGNGLWNMQRRAERMGGRLVLESKAGEGTRVEVRV